MSYHASATISIGLHATQALLEELGIFSVCLKDGGEYSYYFTCRDTKKICECIDRLCESRYYWGSMDLAMRAGVLYAMLKQHWVDYIGAKMRECPYPGGQPRKRYLYKACADYRFEFSQ